VLACVASSPAALAQSDLSSRIHPITGKVKRAGTYHLATGTWTRAPGAQAFLGTSDVIVYANTCNTGYYSGQHPSGGEIHIDEGAIPDEGMPTTASPFIPGSLDTNTGCAASYKITGFQIGYCTYQTVFSANVNFYDNYEPVGTFCTVPGAPTASFALTGLPASSTAGTQTCWLVGFDIKGAGNFTLRGTGLGQNLFGWASTPPRLASQQHRTARSSRARPRSVAAPTRRLGIAALPTSPITLATRSRPARAASCRSPMKEERAC
jgi:hypothetical protein